MSNQKSVRQTKFHLLLVVIIVTPAQKINQLTLYIKQLLLNCIQNNNYNNIPTVSVRCRYCECRFLHDKFINGTTSEAYRVTRRFLWHLEQLNRDVASMCVIFVDEY